ncbi:lysophospholipase L1-like esterase [Methylophilaceae bacterium 11]|nr:lysophospholipase L1-like esterase [Methylophilaceae bacterium 11]
MKSRLLFWVLRVSLVLMPLVASTSHASSTILVFGDSLSAAYGLQTEQGWPTLLAQRLKTERLPYQVVNASVSGETTAGGLTRLNQALQQHKPTIMILALGANDGLRGLPVDAMQQNLSSMLTLAKQQKVTVLLVGMKIPPNYGPQYTQAFQQTFSALAQQFKINLVPFLLENVAGNPALNQDDGIHPTAQAQPIVLENIWPQLKKLLKAS